MAGVVRAARDIFIKAGQTQEFGALGYYILRTCDANASIQVSEDGATFVTLPLNAGHRFPDGEPRIVRLKNPNAFDVTATIEVGYGDMVSERAFAQTGDLAAVPRRFAQIDLTKIVKAIAGGTAALITDLTNLRGIRVKRLAWFVKANAGVAGSASFVKTTSAPSEAGPMEFSVISGTQALEHVFGHSDTEIEFPANVGVSLKVTGSADNWAEATFEVL